ncbi:cob(I)yrinic acid a,c-diamide adenosyltransferase [Sporomusa malonica]|uniref:Cob(I)alamin adenosyltransferase n=1 Tax=Sporomusa malonica TaxID=112901 RepID=A0A1W2EAS5_9FIRM|nr:cob(I)yrinic acid a,c-diamide adenosyltransferase [Sporomusa malonica]SMD06138.1 cob(I)alamin adenosyltransferase [Sporomusa malonica]
MSSKQLCGKIIIFTGSGKGKTTAALGVAIQAAGNGQRAAVVQFLKGGGYTGELYSARYLDPYFSIKQFGFGCPIAVEIQSGEALCTKCGQCFRENRNPANHFAPQALAYAQELMNESVDVLVLDEISHAIKHKLIELEAVLALLNGRTPGMSIVLTGRNMPPEIIEMADDASECRVVKHPIDSGIDARRGIEY